MRALTALISVLALLVVAGCGGDESSTDSSAPSTADPADITTTGDYLAANIPVQLAAVIAATDANPECKDDDLTPGSKFYFDLSIQAKDSPDDTSFEDTINDLCTR